MLKFCKNNEKNASIIKITRTGKKLLVLFSFVKKLLNLKI